MSSLSNNDDEYSSLLLCSGVDTCEGDLDASRLVELGDRTGVSTRVLSSDKGSSSVWSREG